MNSAATLAGLEDIIDRARVAPPLEALLPVGVRPRQLPVRTLLPGMALALADHRPAHLTRVHGALTSLPAGDQARLGVITRWKNGPHQLTCRQTERTFGLAARALEKDAPDGAPAQLLTRLCDDLLEASIPARHKNTTTALAADWSDQETFSRPRPGAAATAPTPKPPGDTARAAAPASTASCSSGTTSPPPRWWPKNTGRPSPSWPGG